MKFFIRALFVFVGLTIFISSCTNNTDNTNTAGIDQSPADSTTPAEKEAGNSEYPALPEKVAQADMATLDGSTSKIADLKGKVLLLNLWATWCGFCREEMPVLVQMQDEHRDQGFEIIGVNIDDETLDQVSQFAEKMKLNYRLVWADSKLTNEFLKISKFGGIPQSFLVDREGRLRGVFTGADPRNLKKMQSLVAKLVSEE